jgi:hypothetical protein
VTNARANTVKRLSIDGPENFLKPIVHEGEGEALSNSERKLVIEAMKASPKALRVLARLGIKLSIVVGVVMEVAHAENANAQEGPLDVAHRLFPQTKPQDLTVEQRQVVNDVLTGTRDSNGKPKASDPKANNPKIKDQCPNGQTGC